MLFLLQDDCPGKKTCGVEVGFRVSWSYDLRPRILEAARNPKPESWTQNPEPNP